MDKYSTQSVNIQEISNAYQYKICKLDFCSNNFTSFDFRNLVKERLVWIALCPNIGSVPLGDPDPDQWSKSSDNGARKEPTNPLWSRIHRFLWCTMIRVILGLLSWSRSFQRNAPIHVVQTTMCFFVSIPCHNSPAMRHHTWRWCTHTRTDSPRFDSTVTAIKVNVSLGTRR